MTEESDADEVVYQHKLTWRSESMYHDYCVNVSVIGVLNCSVINKRVHLNFNIIFVIVYSFKPIDQTN